MRTDSINIIKRSVLYPVFFVVSLLVSIRFLGKSMRKHKIKLGLLILLFTKTQTASSQNLRSLATCYLTGPRFAFDKTTIEAQTGSNLNDYSFGLKCGRIMNLIYDCDLTLGLQSDYFTTTNQSYVFGGAFIRNNYLGRIRLNQKDEQNVEKKRKSSSLTYDLFIEISYSHSFTSDKTDNTFININYSSYSDLGLGMLFRIGRSNSMAGIYLPCRIYSPFSEASWTFYPQIRYVYQFWSLVPF